ncbi:hypothetical protein F5X97DRAFT_139510 [Nemania serpens]|nr:hypothetical protein F5X97DRAFT_139510 [Nemania serpens]
MSTPFRLAKKAPYRSSRALQGLRKALENPYSAHGLADISREEARMKDWFVPESISRSRMVQIIAPNFHPSVAIFRRINKRIDWRLRNRKHNWTNPGQSLDYTMGWTLLPDKYTRLLISVRMRCLDVHASQRLYYAIRNSDLQDRDGMTSALMRIAEQKDDGPSAIADRRLRMLRLMPTTLLPYGAAVPTKTSQMFSFLEKFLPMQFPDPAAAAPFTAAYRLLWTAELLSTELSLRAVANVWQQLEPTLNKMLTAGWNRRMAQRRYPMSELSQRVGGRIYSG